MPRTLGSMMLRPGLQYIGATASNAVSKSIPFVASTTDAAIIELTGALMRVWKNDALITRPAVTAAVANGTFNTDVSSWTDADESGASSVWATGGYLSLVGTIYNRAIRQQIVTVNQVGTVHALRIVIRQGIVTLRVGSSTGADDYVNEAELRPGLHSLAFTPTGSQFVIELAARAQYPSLVDSVAVESSGTMTIAAPWYQSADVLFVACDGYQQRRIERRDNDSWSVVLYEAEDGPFRAENTGNIRITPSALTGSITLTANRPYFRDAHGESLDGNGVIVRDGALFRLASIGQQVKIDVTAEAQWSDPIRVTGVGTARNISVTRAGTWSANVTLQRSVGEIGAWSDVVVYTTNATVTYNDALDNEIIFYRIGVDTGDYTSGTAELNLTYASGSIRGIARVTSLVSTTIANAIILKAFGSTSASENWSEGLWSAYRGWPTSVVIFEGRLWWAGNDRFTGSISDAYESFDDEEEGDAGPINRTIGFGPVDTINWIVPLHKMIAGTDGSELEILPASTNRSRQPISRSRKSRRRVRRRLRPSRSTRAGCSSNARCCGSTNSRSMRGCRTIRALTCRRWCLKSAGAASAW
jgi:hypothetical protein